MNINHIGIVVSDIFVAKKTFEMTYGYVLSHDVIYDPIQHVKLCLLMLDRYCIELIQPIDETSPSYDFMKQGGGTHHICYEVDDLDLKIKELKNKNCMLIKRPQPAVLFNNRRVAFLFDKSLKQMIELLENKHD